MSRKQTSELNRRDQCVLAFRLLIEASERGDSEGITRCLQVLRDHGWRVERTVECSA